MSITINPITGKADVVIKKASKIKNTPAGSIVATNVQTAINELDTEKVAKAGDTMTGDLNVPDEAYGAPWDGSTEVPTKNALYDKIQSLSAMAVGTEATILALTPTSGLTAYGTDTQFFYVADGTNWRRASLKFYTDSANPDMGYLQNNAKDGYYATFITDKYLYNVVLQGYNGTAVNGAIRINTSATPDTLEIYMRDTGWFTIIYDLSMSLGYFVHYPFSATQAVKVWSGNSNELGLNGRPVIQEYDVSMGAYQPAKVLWGGQFL